MKKIADELKKPLHTRAREAEERWRAAHGLTSELNRKSNAKARQRRRRAECPDEPKAKEKYRRYRDKQLGKIGVASTVRRVDPTTWQP